jgi:hypothetical protein
MRTNSRPERSRQEDAFAIPASSTSFFRSSPIAILRMHPSFLARPSYRVGVIIARRTRQIKGNAGFTL